MVEMWSSQKEAKLPTNLYEKKYWENSYTEFQWVNPAEKKDHRKSPRPTHWVITKDGLCLYL